MFSIKIITILIFYRFMLHFLVPNDILTNQISRTDANWGWFNAEMFINIRNIHYMIFMVLSFDIELIWPWAWHLNLPFELDLDLWPWPLTLSFDVGLDIDLWFWAWPFTLAVTFTWHWPLTLTLTLFLIISSYRSSLKN